jgi:hypothetical protein
MVSNIITHMHFLELSKLRKFRVEVLVKGLKVLLYLIFGEVTSLLMTGILVDVSTEDGL